MNFLINDVILKYGTPTCILTDNGTHFTAQLTNNLFQKLGVNHLYTTVYHPQTNGLRERDNRTLKTCLSKLVNEKCNDWNEHLQGALFSYGTAPHSSTKISPYETVFGKKRECQLILQFMLRLVTRSFYRDCKYLISV